MKILAAVLIVLGILAIGYGGFSYKTRETVIDAGPIEVTQEKTNRIPLSPIAGGVAIAAGIGVLIASRKR